MNKPLTISVQTQDRKIYRKDRLTATLCQAAQEDRDVVIDFYPEGSCAEQLGLYRMLDEFCDRLAFDRTRVTIQTANMLEAHSDYRVVRCPDYWYEVQQVQDWHRSNSVDTGDNPTRHFGCFVSRTTWARLWIATYLDLRHRDRTLQTYHYDRQRENYNRNGYVGLDDLFQRDCDIIPECAAFLTNCPRTIDLDFLKHADTSQSIFQHPGSYYPIQVPANLNLINFYYDIFVDIVTEPNVSGNNFLVTEKLWRCIIARRPFIVLGTGSYLYHLRKLGFQTFGRWWSEDYDGQTDQTRIKMIVELLDEIADWNHEKCRVILNDMQSVLEHNYEIFMQLRYEKLREIFC
jgi:hypothetical protein